MPASAPVERVKQLVVVKLTVLAAEIVRGLPAGQLALEPLHTWPVVHMFPPPPQEVPAATKPSAGQVAELPVQFSATSQTPAEGRHTVDEFWNASAGQA